MKKFIHFLGKRPQIVPKHWPPGIFHSSFNILGNMWQLKSRGIVLALIYQSSGKHEVVYLARLYEVRFAWKGMSYSLCHIQLQTIRELNPASHRSEDHDVQWQKEICSVCLFLLCSKSPPHTRHFSCSSSFTCTHVNPYSFSYIFSRLFSWLLFFHLVRITGCCQPANGGRWMERFIHFIAQILHQCSMSV